MGKYLEFDFGSRKTVKVIKSDKYSKTSEITNEEMKIPMSVIWYYDMKYSIRKIPKLTKQLFCKHNYSLGATCEVGKSIETVDFAQCSKCDKQIDIEPQEYQGARYYRVNNLRASSALSNIEFTLKNKDK